MTNNSPIEDKLTYLCYYLAVKYPHILTDVRLFVGGMLAENTDAHNDAKSTAAVLVNSYKRSQSGGNT